jgi:acetyl-CoA carboxylase biotin carboxyl carrier protein
MSSDSDQKLPDLRYIRELAKVFKQYELDELEIETGEARMLLRRSDYPAAPPSTGVPTYTVPHAGPSVAPSPARPQPQGGVETLDEGLDYITSPFVGTFYRSPRPDAPSFIEAGQKATPGQTVCIIEAMKLFNEIEADFPCIIEEALVESGEPVEYGAKLFRVRKL